MKELIDIIKKMKMFLLSLQKILSEEYIILLQKDGHKKQLDLIVQKKDLCEQLKHLQKDKLILEKKYNFFAPYINNEILNAKWGGILAQCKLLQSLTLQNKKILNEKFYINQNFLELLSSSADSTYDSGGNLQF